MKKALPRIRFQGLVIAICLCRTVPAYCGTLNVNQKYQEQTEWCWAASCQSVLEFYGLAVTQTNIAAYGAGGANVWDYLWGSGDPGDGIFRRGCDLILSKFGGVASSGYTGIMTLSQLQAEIDGLIPVIINWEWDSGGGHILVAYGVISSNVCLMDPWYGPSVDDYAWVCQGGGHTWEWTLQISTASVTTNGVPRWWLGMYGLTNQWQWDAMALGDQDGTGQNNLFKYLAGLNPTNPASVFKITSSVPTGTNFLVTWQTAGPRTNVVQATNGGPKGSYNTNFQDISGLIIINTTGDTTTNYTDPGGATNLPSRFYRIRLGP